MAKKKNELAVQGETQIDETDLFKRVSEIIESRKSRAGAFANREVTLMHWEVGHYINSVILDGGRAAYGKRIVTTLSSQLVAKYGYTFEVHNLRRMMRFAERFADFEIVTTLSSQLSWSHILELLPLKTEEARLYYAELCAKGNLSVQGLRGQIRRKAYERREIANAQLTDASTIPFNAFKDPFLLDVLNLKENYMEGDLEKAVLAEIQKFILEFGQGFAFIESQKRMPIEDEDVVLDLLFYNRIIKRLVAVELKLEKFEAADKGQMELYLAWLDENERREGEEPPIGIILCPSASRKKVEMLKMDRAGIAVAEYWTTLPPKAEFEKKINEIMEEAKERLARRKMLPSSEVKREIEYFYEPKEDDE